MSSTIGARTLTLMRSPRTLRTVRVVFAGLLLLSVLLFAVALPVRFSELNTVDNQAVYQITVAEVDLLARYGISHETYATYVLAFETLQASIFVVVGIFLFWRRPDDFMAVFTAQTLLLIGIIAPATTDALVRTGQNSQLLTFLDALRIALVMIFIYIFPDGRFTPVWTRWIAGLSAIIIVGLRLFVGNPASWLPLAQSVGVLLWLGLPLLNQVYRYRRLYTLEQRQQTKWFVFGMLFVMAGTVLRGLLATLFPALDQPGAARLLFTGVIAIPLLDTLVFAVMPLSIAASIFRYRLYGIDLVVNRSLVYGGLTLALAMVFFSGFFIIQAMLQVIGGQSFTLSLVISMAVSAALFNPARVAMQRFVDKHFFHLRVGLDRLEQRREQAAEASASSPRAGSLAGKTLGVYEVETLVGRGGMSEVYRAHHRETNRVVAIKALSEMLMGEQEFKSRFEREARTVAALNHPNIIGIFDFGVVDELYYMVMEYVEGEPLSHRLKSGALNLEQTQGIIADIASALDYAHARHLVHRDIKPSNVMLRRQQDSVERAVLMDFGIAKIVNADTWITGSGMVGTLDYAAPEQIMSARKVDSRADIYSLGVMTYQMLTGRLPFKGSVGEVVFAHLQQPAPDPRDLAPDLSLAATLAIMRALSKNPDDRYDTAGEFLAALGYNGKQKPL